MTYLRRARLALLAAVLSGLGCAAPSEPPAEIPIGFTPDGGVLGGDMALKAGRLAVDSVNAAGGLDVGGRLHPVRLFVEDTDNTPEGAARAVLTLVNQKRVVALVGPSFSSLALPAGAVADQARVPVVVPGASHPEVTALRRYVFRVIFTDAAQGRAMARFARHRLGHRSAAILWNAAERYSRSIAEAFKASFEAAGGQVVAAEAYVPGHSGDLRELIRRLLEARPEVLFLPNYSDDVVGQVTLVRELGSDAVVLGTDSWLIHQLTVEPVLEGAYLSQPWHPDLAASNPVARDFLAAYEAAYGESPGNVAALTYDAFGLVFDAVRRAGRIDSDAVREALAATADYPGVTGTVTFEGTEGDPRRPVVIVRIEDRKARLVEVMEGFSKEEHP